MSPDSISDPVYREQYRKVYDKHKKEVAEKLGVVESCYANWEQGRTEPNIDTLRKLCVIFDVDISDLIY